MRPPFSIFKASNIALLYIFFHSHIILSDSPLLPPSPTFKGACDYIGPT